MHDATIELRLPSSLKAPVWSHPLLGKAIESREGDTRVLRWAVKDVGERRIEEGTPRMDRDVSVSVSTATWSDTARALRETRASLDEGDSEVRAWAIDAAGGKTKPREVVDAVVAAAGESVKESAASTLSDVEVGRPDGSQQTTARTILTNHEGVARGSSCARFASSAWRPTSPRSPRAIRSAPTPTSSPTPAASRTRWPSRT